MTYGFPSARKCGIPLEQGISDVNYREHAEDRKESAVVSIVVRFIVD